MFFLTGVARYLFVPMAKQSVFAMLRRICCRERWWPDDGDVPARGHEHDTHKAPTTFFGRLQPALKRASSSFAILRDNLANSDEAPPRFVLGFLGCVCSPEA